MGKIGGAHVIEVVGSQDVVIKNLSITDGGRPWHRGNWR